MSISPPSDIYDVIGVGFGPSNLALAVALQEQAAEPDAVSFNPLFLEYQRQFSWHAGMLLKNTQMQISFLKDLVTLRNPSSKFTFLNYLKKCGRLDAFVNLREFYPSRIEFNKYFSWVAAELEDHVHYGRKIIDVLPIECSSSDIVEALKVVAVNTHTEQVEEYISRNLVLATGGEPLIPECIDIQSCQRVFHSQKFLYALTEQFPDSTKEHHFVVVGSGQSAAEIFHHLLSSYPNSHVTAVMRQFAYKVADDSNFVNEIFFPHMVDFLYSLPDGKRNEIFRQYSNTNYSAVDNDLIQIIYRDLYEQKVSGESRCRILPFAELQDVVEHPTKVVARFRNLLQDQHIEMDADAIILATGYKRFHFHPLLKNLAPYFNSEHPDKYVIDRDYTIKMKPNFLPKVFLQGFCEDTHGISDTLLSILPYRAQEIVQALVAHRPEAYTSSNL